MTISEQEILVGFGPFQKNTAVYAVNVVVWDIYNFDEYRDGNSLGSILNNFGYDLQKKGYLTPFSWRAQYTVYINQ